jgi:hypothetical protein
MRPGQIVGPILLIVLGTFFLVDNLVYEISFGRLVSRYWPVALIIIGALQLAKSSVSDPSRRWGHLAGGAVTVAMGILFQMQQLHIARFSDTWPALLILIGALGLLRALAVPGSIGSRMRGGFSR